MAVKIGHASIDERGKARGGAVGDQTGKEVCIRDWYDKNWVSVLRPKNEKEAEKMAKAMEQACANNHIGYDQSQRTTCLLRQKRLGLIYQKLKLIAKRIVLHWLLCVLMQQVFRSQRISIPGMKIRLLSEQRDLKS